MIGVRCVNAVKSTRSAFVSKVQRRSFVTVAVNQSNRIIRNRPITSIQSSNSFQQQSSNQSKSIDQSFVRSFSSAGGDANILVWADHDGKSLHSSTYNVVSAAKKIGGNVTILVTGQNVSAIAEAAARLPVKAVLMVDDAAYAHQLAENLSALVASVIKSGNYGYLLVPTTSNGKNILGRVGMLLDSQPVTDIIEVKSPNTFVRPIYAGNALSTVEILESVKLLSVRPTNFERTEPADATVKPESTPSTIEPTKQSEWVKNELTVSERPDLSTARVVVAGGPGMKSGDNFKLLDELADQFSGAVGASRAAVDAGMVPNEYQVGQTGKVVAPDLYIAVGISGAIQHLAGMKDSKVIVAVNKDKEAPIFQVADYGLVGDLFTVVPELTKAVKAAKSQ